MPNPVNKGKRGEKELAAFLSRVLGDIVVVNPHDNEADLQSIPGLAIEVKRQETLVLKRWWDQTLRQAEKLDRIPVLAWRKNRGDWQFGLPGYLLVPGSRGEDMMIVQKTTFVRWIKLWLAS